MAKELELQFKTMVMLEAKSELFIARKMYLIEVRHEL